MHIFIFLRIRLDDGLHFVRVISMDTDEVQLALIRKSVTNPPAEEEAKKLFLSELYEEVKTSYNGKASNGGIIAPLPPCVKEHRQKTLELKEEACREDLSFTYNGLRVLHSRYLSRDEHGRIVETPSMVMRRVAMGFRDRVDPEKLYDILISRRFIFNSPTLFNMYINGSKGALSACYVTPVYDDMRSIMNATVVQAMTFKYGGGQGFSFSNLRPRWSLVRGTGSYSSGPLSFMRIFDAVTDSVKQGGKRRGANMGILHDWHPDIYNPYFDPLEAFSSSIPLPVKKVISQVVGKLVKEGYEVSETLKRLADGKSAVSLEDAGFIQAKRYPLGDVFLTNFNISVGIHDAFMEAVLKNKDWVMVSPRLSSETTGVGDYRRHYSISRSTGLGTVERFINKIKTPFFSILEDEVDNILRTVKNRTDVTLDEKNPVAWKTKARKIWKEIIEGAWETGDPGLLFLDNHNKWSPTPWLGVVVATNPCVSGDTLILTENGWKTAKEIYEEAKRLGVVKAVLASEKTLGKDGNTRAYPVKLISVKGKDTVYETVHGNQLELLEGAKVDAWVWHVGRKDGVRIRAGKGYEITVTKEHRFLTPNGWKEAANLKPGEKILVSRLSPDTYRNINGIKIDEDIAFLLGWIVGDGTLNDYYAGFYFNKKETEAKRRVLEGLKKLDVEEPESYIIERGNESMLLIQGRAYKKIVELLGGKLDKQPQRHIPRKVWEFSFDSLRWFLRGLFTADGTVDSDKAIRLTSASLPLLREVQILLTGFGIYSKIYRRPYRRRFTYITKNGEKREYESKEYYELIISGYSRKIFMELIGFENESKNVKVSLKKTKIDTLWATVEAIEEVKDVDFYDFTVPDLHNYIANGLVNHNCGEQFLYSYESCNLGSISVEKYVEGSSFDLDRFYRDIQVVVDAMDAVIDYNNHPDVRQDKANKFTRKIGLGIMGLADLLTKLGLKYDSDEGVAVTTVLMAGLEVFSWKRSWELGAKLGHAPAFECLTWDWRTMTCLEKGEPEELLEMHTPALVKADTVRLFKDGWMILKYHNIAIPDDVISSLAGEAKNRVKSDGSVRLLREDALEKVARTIFGVTREMAEKALNMPTEEIVDNPRILLALAIWKPRVAWDVLVKYGKSLGARAPRNTVMTTVAPTGSISIIAGTSSGIEPYFALVYRRHVAVGDFLEVVREFRDRLLRLVDDLNLDRSIAEKIFEVISRHKGSLRWALKEIRNMPELPTLVITRSSPPIQPIEEIERLAEIFATSMDFDPWYHVAHNAAAQLYVDQSISKTVNLAKDTGKGVVETVYLTGWLLGLKGVTVYRDESKTVQVIYFGDSESEKTVQELFWKTEKNRRKRLIIPKRTMKLSELEKDPKAMEIFNIKQLPGTNGDGNGSSEVVVELEENSTCKTCEF